MKKDDDKDEWKCRKHKKKRKYIEKCENSFQHPTQKHQQIITMIKYSSVQIFAANQNQSTEPEQIRHSNLGVCLRNFVFFSSLQLLGASLIYKSVLCISSCHCCDHK